MRLLDFSLAHVEQAKHLIVINYDEERAMVPALPLVKELPDLVSFADKATGIAALDGDELLGFLCWDDPRDNYFGECKGTWSQIHAHGAVPKDRVYIYDRLYQTAAEKLTSDGVFCHSVTLYEHDIAASESFINNGFGRRCVDAVRLTAGTGIPPPRGVTCREADIADAEEIANMNNALVRHLRGTPSFLYVPRAFTPDDISKGILEGKYQYYLALKENRPAAYIRLEKEGENFITDDTSMMNISGAYALPEVRGKGIAAGLLSWLMDRLNRGGITRCGVDFECFNATARKFWLKYFTAYTNSVVRRVDERNFTNR